MRGQGRGARAVGRVTHEQEKSVLHGSWPALLHGSTGASGSGASFASGGSTGRTSGVRSSGQSPTAPGFGERNPRYQLRPGDVFDLSFPFSPEFNQTVTVQPDGFVTLREAGDLKVASLTVPQLRQAIAARYGTILKAPEVIVVLKEFERPYFIADGQVGKPGKYELRGDTTVLQGLAMAGGMKESAKHSQVLLFRRLNDQWSETKILDLKAMLHSKNLAEDIDLRPGDMIFVPQNRISKISRYLPTPGLGMGFTY